MQAAFLEEPGIHSASADTLEEAAWEHVVADTAVADKAIANTAAADKAMQLDTASAVDSFACWTLYSYFITPDSNPTCIRARTNQIQEIYRLF